jgi:large repetitive protein
MGSFAAITSLLITGLVWAQPAAAADTCGTAWPAKWPAGGTGSSATPYLIDDSTSLAAISACSGSYFALEKNITLTGAWTPIFDGSSGTAYLDGRGWSISGLSITGSHARAGLFGQLNGGYIRNLTLVSPSVTSSNATGWTGAFAGDGQIEYTNVHVSGGTIAGAANVGGIVGNLGGGSITGSSSSAAIVATGSGSLNVGGLAGFVNSGTVTQSFAAGSISASGAVAGYGSGVGGLQGNSNGFATNSYSSTVISAPSSEPVGGIVGYNACTATTNIVNTYATGSITGLTASTQVGGIIGGFQYDHCADDTTQGSYFNTQTTGQLTGTGSRNIFAKTTAQMQDDTTYVGWSTSIWRLVDGSYPTFKNGAISVASSTSFGDFTVGVPISRTITVTNSGDDTLSVLDTDVSGANASNFTVGSLAGCASVAPEGGTCTFTVTLTATAAGTQSANLAIATSDGVGNVALIGGPTPSAATVTWTPISTPTAGPFTYTLAFSTSITGLTAGDFTNKGTATGCAFSPSASSGTSFTITISSCSSGTLIAQINAGSVTTSVGAVSSPIGFEVAVNTLANSWSVGNKSTAMAMSRDGSKLYTFSVSSRQIQVYNTSTRALLSTISLSMPVSGSKGYLVASPTSNRIYVATNQRSNGIYVIDSSTDTEVTAARVLPTSGGPTWNSMSISPDGRHLYLPTVGSAIFRQIKVDTSVEPMSVETWSDNITTCFSKGSGVEGVVVSSDSSTLYQLGGSECSSYVWTQLTSDFTASWPSTYSNTGYPYRVALSRLMPTAGVLSPNGAFLYLSRAGALQRFDATQPIASDSPSGASSILPVPSASKSIMTITADGTKGYLPNGAGVSAVNLSTMALASPSTLQNGSLPSPGNANTAILAKDEASLFVLHGATNRDAASVSQFALASLQAESVTVVVKLPQTVSWAPTTSITTMTMAPSATATTNGNGTISYAVTSAGTTGCTVNSSTAALTFTGAGSCQITASATETTTYAATSTAVTFTVALTPQTITVSAGTTTPEVFSTTGLSTSGVVGTGQVTYAVASGGSNCSIANSTLTGSAVGSCTVTSSVTADAMYASATSSAITISVQKAPQTVTWAPTNTSLSFNDSPVTPSVGATTDGDGAIAYSKVSGGCSVDASTGTLTYSATGTCVVRATAATSSTYSAGTRDVTFAIAADRPTAPTITSASAGDGTATVAFTVPSSNGGATITGYTATATPGGATGTCSSSPCTVSGLSNTASYTITVRAVNSAGQGATSDSSPSVSPATSTGEVENLSVLPGNGELAVSWVAPACLRSTPTSSCGTLIGYTVFTSTNRGISWTQFGVSATDDSKTVTGLVNGTQYDVKVTVTTSSSSKDAFAQQVPATTPSAPTDVTVARLTATTVSVGWSPPLSNGGQPITGYTVTATSSNGGATVDDTALATDDTLTLTVDKTYTITVRASNLMGLGAISAASPAFNTGLAPQTITVVPEATTMPATSSMLLSTSGSTGTGAKSFAVSSGPCTVSGAALTATAAGTCVVTATIAADALNAAATSTGVPVTVTLAPQTVSWAPTTVFTATPSTVTLASATASAGGLPAYSVTSAGTAGCSFSGGSTLVFTGQGTCTVQVVAGATSTHSASAPVSLTISVIAATRSITWSPSTTLDDTNSGQPASALAVILAGTGTPAYSVLSAGATGCSVTAATAVITFTAPGTCILTATAPSNATYAVATTSVTFTISSAPQTVTWSPTTDLTVEQSPVTVTPATSTGAGSITYSVTSPGAADCQITPNTGVLSYSEEGECTVQAMAAARTGYAASAPATVTFDVTASPTPTPTPPSPSVFAPGQPLGLTAVAGDAMASVSWTAPADPGSYPVTDYSVTASPGGGTCLVEAPARTCDIRGLTNGTSYTFRAKALNGAGWGPYSDPSNAVTPRGPAQGSIVIAGSRGVVKGSPGVIVTGTSTELGAGAILRPWVRLPGQTSYAEGGARILVDASGAFTWQRRTGKVVYVYMQTEDASLRSNRVIIRQG